MPDAEPCALCGPGRPCPYPLCGCGRPLGRCVNPAGARCNGHRSADAATRAAAEVTRAGGSPAAVALVAGLARHPRRRLRARLVDLAWRLTVGRRHNRGDRAR